MGSKGGKAPPAPDYTPVAEANREAAQISANVAREQLAWARQQYASDQQVTNRVLNQLLPTMEAEGNAAAADRERYKSVFQPVEDQLLAEANAYASPERIEFEAGRAVADVSQAFEGARQQQLAMLSSYGIDPSMARAGALDTGVQVQRALAEATASNNSRLNTEATGRALRGAAIDLGRGYQSQIAQAYATAQNAGAGALGGALQTTASGANTMGTGLGWQQSQQGFLGNWGSALGGQAAANNARAQAQSASGGSTGAIIGGIAGIAGAVLAPFTGGASLALSAAGAGLAQASMKGG